MAGDKLGMNRGGGWGSGTVFVGVGGKELTFALNEGRSPCRVLAVEGQGLIHFQRLPLAAR